MFSASKTAGPSGYNINNSLRLRSSASAYLNRTPATTTNRKTFTYSSWYKRGEMNTPMQFLWANNATTFQTNISLSSDYISVTLGNGSVKYQTNTSAVFRDPSAWYHIVVAVDTTQTTSSDRLKIYVNNQQQTAFLSVNYPPQNFDTWINSNSVTHYIGAQYYNGSYTYTNGEGYLAEVNFIDGQALTPSSFGSTNATTGVWQPKKYTGTYGTNGFYLPFSDIATTSGSNAGLGKDFSGNSNYWTTNNISVTAGTTYDAMTDSPTLTSATVANYAVMSPIDFITANGTISSANLNWASSTNVCGNRATIGSTSGKWYWEAIGSSVTSGTIGGRFAFTGSDTIAVEQDKFGMYWHPTSGIARIVNGTNTYVTSAYTYTNSDVLALALDLDNNISYWYKNGVLQYTYDFSAYSTIGARVFFPYVWNASSGTPSWVYNFGQRPFAYTPPTGFNRLNTFNLPTSTIVKGNSYMDATTYTGTGSSLAVTNAGAFKPDFLWVKDRSRLANHILVDSVRGVNNLLRSESTAAEVAGSFISSLNSNGFTLSANTISDSYYTNVSGDTFVGWQWQAGQGSTSSNTSGSITSTVSVNTTAGFSVVTWSGTGSAATIGHGLGVAPKMVIMKRRNGATNWPVWVTGFSSTSFLFLQSTNAVSTTENYFNSVLPSSTLLNLSGNSEVNGSGGTYVAYCWAEIAGFSKFGSYTGNGSTDGPFVYTGFRPKFLMVKRTDTTSNWNILDSSRDLYNPEQQYLLANLSNAEATFTLVDFVANGFKNRSTDAAFNASGGTYIYAAFAENPFKNALAR